MKIAMLGGTFNPIHIGHLAIADDVCNFLGYDKVLFVPTKIPPHKIVSNLDNAHHRAKMIELAIKNDSRFELETCELDREGVSYSIDTATFLTKKFSATLDGKIGLVVGQENAAEFDKWRDAENLAIITDVIIARRRNFFENLDAGKNQNQQDYKNIPFGTYTGGFEESDYEKVCSTFKHNFLRLENIYLPISSTQIRKRISQRQGFRYLVPNEVFEYIVKNKLYE